MQELYIPKGPCQCAQTTYSFALNSSRYSLYRFFGDKVYTILVHGPIGYRLPVDGFTSVPCVQVPRRVMTLVLQVCRVPRQRQYPLIKEYTLNHNMKPPII